MIGARGRTSSGMEEYPQAILGAGKQAAHVLHLMEAMGLPWKDCSLFDNRYKQGARDQPIVGTMDDGIRLCSERQLSAIVALGSRAAAARYSIFQQAVRAGVHLVSLIHPSCVIAPSASIGQNVVMMPGCVVGPVAEVGSLCCFFSNVTVEHDCTILDNVVLGPGVALSGDVKIGAHCFLGTGAVCSTNVQIQDRVLVGAGAVVVSNQPSGSVCSGVPARTMRNVREGDDVPTEAQLKDLCRCEVD